MKIKTKIILSIALILMFIIFTISILFRLNVFDKTKEGNESNIEIIQKLMERNNGYITTKELKNFDISRNYLSIMTKRNMIEKETLKLI